MKYLRRTLLLRSLLQRYSEPDLRKRALRAVGMTILVSEVLGFSGRRPEMFRALLALLLGGIFFLLLSSFLGPSGGATTSGRVLSVDREDCRAEISYRAEGKIFSAPFPGECDFVSGQSVEVAFRKEDPTDAQIASGNPSFFRFFVAVPLIIGGGVFLLHLASLTFAGIFLYRGRAAPQDNITERIEEEAKALLTQGELEAAETGKENKLEEFPPVFEPRDP